MNKIKLMPFDQDFFESIRDYKKIHLDSDNGIYYTIVRGKEMVGVIGFKAKIGEFLKIGIHQDFRGQGIFQQALNLLVKKHKIKKIYSTIALANLASIKAHKKIGFKKVSKKQEDFLRKSGFLLKRNTRLFKVF